MTFSARYQRLVASIMDLRLAEEQAPEVELISVVRERLERQLGPTLTAELYRGCSASARPRWIATCSVAISRPS